MKINIGRLVIGNGHPAMIIAEMSGNHGGDLNQALEIVRAAKRAGADAIKLQTYTADTITLKSDKEDFRITSNSPWAEYSTMWDLYERASTPWEWHPAIFEEANRLGLEVFSSPFDETAVDYLEELKAPAYKIASPEITHVPLLIKVARTGKPIILSAGVANLSDIQLALDVLRNEGAKDIVLLKCTSSYPAPPEEANLKTIADITKNFGVLAGLSDHTLGNIAAIVAASLGACVIEKHFIPSKDSETVDSFFSLDEQEFLSLVKDVRWAENALGEVSYEITPSAAISLRGRRSLYVSKSIKKGELITTANIKCVRPSFGMHPKYYQDVLGRTALIDLELGDRLSWDVLN